MTILRYNDVDFAIVKGEKGWNISRKLPNGSDAAVGANLFADVSDADAEARAISLVKTIFPVGIRTIGPDTMHPNLIGDLKIVGPDVGHPNFIYWNKDSTSFAK